MKGLDCRKVAGCAFAILLGSLPAFAENVGPSLSLTPSGSFILLEGTDTNGVEHVLHSTPSLGIGAELSFQHLFKTWSPQFDISTHTIHFSGVNGETVQYNSDYYTSYEIGVEKEILNSWVASGAVGYTDQLFVRVPSANEIIIDKVKVPEATVATKAGVVYYKGYLLAVGAKVIAYFPASTPDYSAKLGYGIEPTISTTHVFSRHITGSGEFFYQKRVQNSSAFDLTEQDFGIALTILLN